MARTWRLLLLGLLVIILSVILVDSAITSPALTLRLSSWDTPQQELWKKVVAEFEKENPDLKIQLEFADFWAYWQRLMTESMTGTAADITQNMVGTILDYAYKKAVMDLTPFIKRDLNMKDYVPGIFANYQYPMGKKDAPYYGVPFICFNRMLYYNETLFDNYGVVYPQNSTWSSFLEAAKKLTRDINGDGKIDIWGFDTDPSHDQMLVWIATAGGRFWDDKYEKCLINQPAALKGLQFYVDLVLKHKVAPAPAQRMQGIIPFMSGKIAMVIDGNWVLAPFLTIKEFKWDVANLPRGAREGNIIGPGTFAIPATAKHPEESWRFLKFFLSKKVQIMLGQGGYGIPVHKEAIKEYYDPNMPPKHLPTILANLSKPPSPGTMQSHKAMEYRKVFDDALMEVLLGKKPLKQAMDEAAEKIDQVVAQW
jgi:multiple sugar transport system substrate-binding protein